MSAEDPGRSFAGYPDAIRLEREEADQRVIDVKGQGGKAEHEGAGCSPLREPLPTFEKLGCEFISPGVAPHLWGRHRIVFGRDRNDREGIIGYGGRGCTTAGSIDIVVGSQGSQPKHNEAVGPNFFTDAARIYITQRGDIDRYFSLPVDENIGIKPSENRSAIGIKADAVRIVGREGVRIVTNARTAGSTPKEHNSRGGEIQSDGPDRGIHLIAHERVGTYMTVNPSLRFKNPPVLFPNRLQSLVKGENLVEALKELVELIRDMNVIIQDFSMAQMTFNNAVAFHTHSTTGAPVALPSPSIIGPWCKTTIEHINHHIILMGRHNTTLGGWFKMAYFDPYSNMSFLSRYNKTN
jgi:hypothetical protein